MRIPVYQPQVNPTGQQMSTPRVAQPLDLSAAINAAEQQAGIAMREQEAEYKSYVIAETERTQLDIDTKYKEIMERVKSGGSYADAQKEFEKFYQQKTQASFERFKDDPVVMRSLTPEYEKIGVEYGLRIKDAVRSRVKSDARNALSSKIENAVFDLGNAENEVQAHLAMSKITDAYAKGQGAGIFSDAQARKGIIAANTSYVNRRIDLDPAAFLQDVNDSPDLYKNVKELPQKKKLAKEKIRKLDLKLNNEMTEQQFMSNISLADRIARGEVTANDIEENPNNPIIKSYLSKAKASSMPDIERNNRILDLKKELSEMESVFAVKRGKPPEILQTEEGFAKAREMQKEYEKKVLQAVDDGVFTGRQSQSYLPLLQNNAAIFQGWSAPLTKPEVNDGFMWFDSSYSKNRQSVVNMAESLSQTVPLLGGDKFDMKIDFRNRMEQILPEIDQMKGSERRDALQIALIQTMKDMVSDTYPELEYSPLFKEAQRVLLDDGSDIKADSQIKETITEEAINKMSQEELMEYLSQ